MLHRHLCKYPTINLPAHSHSQSRLRVVTLDVLDTGMHPWTHFSHFYLSGLWSALPHHLNSQLYVSLVKHKASYLAMRETGQILIYDELACHTATTVLELHRWRKQNTNTHLKLTSSIFYYSYRSLTNFSYLSVHISNYTELYFKMSICLPTLERSTQL